MNAHTLRWTGLLLLGGTALASIAPAVADACSECSVHRPHRSHSRVVRAVFNHGVDHWCDRDYFYEDPYCGITNSHVSKLTAHYDRCGHPPIVHMIDLRTHRVRNTYARDDGEWRKVRSRHTCNRSCDHDHGRYAYAGHWDD